MNQNKTKVILFWILFMLGIVIHSVGDLLPMFWGVDIAMEHSGNAPAGMLSLMMVIEYVLPLIAILFVYYGKSRLSSIINLSLASLIALFNLAHCSELVMEFSYTKLFTLPFILLVSIILVIESWKYLHTIKS